MTAPLSNCRSCVHAVDGAEDCARPTTTREIDRWMTYALRLGQCDRSVTGCPGYERRVSEPRPRSKVPAAVTLQAVVAAEPGLTTAELAARLGLKGRDVAGRLRRAGLIGRVTSERRPGKTGRGSGGQVARWFPSTEAAP